MLLCVRAGMFHYFPVDYKPEFAPGERGQRAECIDVATNDMIDSMDNVRPILLGLQ